VAAQLVTRERLLQRTARASLVQERALLRQMSREAEAMGVLGVLGAGTTDGDLAGVAGAPQQLPLSSPAAPRSRSSRWGGGRRGGGGGGGGGAERHRGGGGGGTGLEAAQPTAPRSATSSSSGNSGGAGATPLRVEPGAKPVVDPCVCRPELISILRMV
jgi:hypothetical protein